MTSKKNLGRGEQIHPDDLCKLKAVKYDPYYNKCKICPGNDRTCELYVSTNIIKRKERILGELYKK